MILKFFWCFDVCVKHFSFHLKYWSQFPPLTQEKLTQSYCFLCRSNSSESALFSPLGKVLKEASESVASCEGSLETPLYWSVEAQVPPAGAARLKPLSPPRPSVDASELCRDRLQGEKKSYISMQLLMTIVS